MIKNHTIVSQNLSDIKEDTGINYMIILGDRIVFPIFVLDRKLSEKRIFPAIDIAQSGTRREDLLLSNDELGASYIIRKEMNGMRKEDAVEQILNLFARTKNNDDFIKQIAKIRVSHSRR